MSAVFAVSLSVTWCWTDYSNAQGSEKTPEIYSGTSYVSVGTTAREVAGLRTSEDTWFVDLKAVPEGVHREALWARDRSMVCTDAASALLTMENAAKLGFETAATRHYTVRRYAEACLIPLETVSDPNGTYAGAFPENAATLLKMVGTGELARLRRSLVFTDPSIGRMCSGTLVWLPLETGSSLSIATAAHCMGRVSRGENAESRKVSVSLAIGADFLNIGGVRYQIDFENAMAEVTFDPLGEDFAFLPVLGDFDPQLIGVSLAKKEISNWQPLYVIGQNRYLDEVRFNARKSLNDTSRGIPSHATVIGMDTFCRAFGQAGNVLMHNCQTVTGTSGAGLFVYEDGKLALAGVHSGYRAVFEQISYDIDEVLKVASGSRAVNFATLFGLRE